MMGAGQVHGVRWTAFWAKFKKFYLGDSPHPMTLIVSCRALRVCLQVRQAPGHHPESSGAAHGQPWCREAERTSPRAVLGWGLVLL